MQNWSAHASTRLNASAASRPLFSERFHSIVQELGELPAKTAVLVSSSGLDQEAVVRAGRVRSRAGSSQRGHKGRVLTAVTAPAGRTALPIVAPRAVSEPRW